MTRRLLSLGLLLSGLLVITAWTFMPRMNFQPQSQLWVEGTSTLHGWKMSAARFDGAVYATAADQVGNVKVTVPVTELTSDNNGLDKKAYEALKSNAHPTITYELDAADLQAAAQNGKFKLNVRGKLQIAGVTKPVVFAVDGEQLADGRARYTGSVPVKMTDFGMKPPTAMLGAVRAGDDVVVHFNVLTAP